MDKSKDKPTWQDMASLVDKSDWRGVSLKSERVGADEQKKFLNFEGMQFVTEGERLLAVLLRKMAIPFTPNVMFKLKAPPERPHQQEVIYVPDFILNRRAYLWNHDGSVELVHGFEAKGLTPASFTAKAREKIDLLRNQRGINVKMLCERDIRLFTAIGGLPLSVWP